MPACAGHNNVIDSITELYGVVKSLAEEIWDNLGTPVEVSRPAPENSLKFFDVFSA